MEKVGIITLHRVCNYGSVLQAYALQKKIDVLGYNSFYIDYFPERLHIFGMLRRLKTKSPKLRNPLIRLAAQTIILPSYLKKRSVFRKFNKKYLKLSPSTYIDINDFAKDIVEADIFCTGSDQVWNTEWNEKVDLPFYLSFTDKPKIAYAASFGKNDISEQEKKEILPLLSDYQSISVREKSALTILESMDINGEHVLDPTLLLESNEWSQIASKKYQGKKYILMYNLNRNMKMWNIAKQLSKIHKLKLIYVSYNYHEIFRYGRMACNAKVEDFLSLVENATVILTDSFHATAFSLNFNRDFYIIYPQKFSTRLQSVLEMTNLTRRVIDNVNQINLDDHINYEEVNSILTEKRKISINVLEKSLREAKSFEK